MENTRIYTYNSEINIREKIKKGGTWKRRKRVKSACRGERESVGGDKSVGVTVRKA